jgi:Rhodopirellula transposase DDE domain
VAKLLKAEGFSLQANAKTIEGAQHPDRDAQFRYLNDQARVSGRQRCSHCPAAAAGR